MKIIIFFFLMTVTCFADNPNFRRHIIWYDKNSGTCKVDEWFVDPRDGSVITGEGDPDKAFYEPHTAINQDPFCMEISKPDKSLIEN